MPVTVVVGGQFGSEGKGKVAHFFAKEQKATVVVRVGGTNSGHTVIDSSGFPVVFRQLPTAALLPHVTCVLGAGSYIDLDVLFAEIALSRLSEDCLLIDPNAMLITEYERFEEKNSRLRESIGSTLSGTGAAVRKRIERTTSVRLAKHEARLYQFVKPVVPFLRERLAEKERVIVEGTQGFGLSLLHSIDYPYVTSRDTTAAAFIAEAGLSPLDVDEIVLVLRTFPIRVGGNSGHLPYEVDWQTVSSESGSSLPLVEHTSVTRSVRRVGRFDDDVVRQAIMVNRPTCIVLNHLDYVDFSCRDSNVLSEKVSRFVDEVESCIDASIDYLGNGPSFLVKRAKSRLRSN